MVSSSNGQWFPSLLQYQKNSFNNKDDSKRNFIQFQNKSIVEQVIVNTENYRKAFLQKINFEVGNSILFNSLKTELPNKR